MYRRWVPINGKRTHSQASCKLTVCKRIIPPGGEVFYLVREKNWVPFCSEGCRVKQLSKWQKRDEGHEDQLALGL